MYISQVKAQAVHLIQTPSGISTPPPPPPPTPNPNIKFDIKHPAVGVRCIIPPRHLSQLKAWAIPSTKTPSGIEICRPSVIFHGICIGSPPNPNIKAVI